MGASDLDKSAFDLQRLVVFCDAVFAIVITLLVLPLTSEVEEIEGDQIAGAVLSLWPHLSSFVVTFVVVGQFWLVHHRMYGRFARADGGLVRLSLLNLLTVTFTPFPAALLGEHSTTGDRFPVVFYAVSLTVTSFTFTATWLYALRHGLVKQDLGSAHRVEVTIRSFVVSGVFLVSVGAAFFGLMPAVFCWLVLLPVARGIAVRRHRARAMAV